MAEGLSPLEREVIATILAPDHPVMNALHAQLARCHVTSREPTGVGFFTWLGVAADVEPAPVRPGTLDLADVVADIEGLEHGAGFVLFIEDGILDVLEGFSYDEPWTDIDARYEVRAGGVSHGPGSPTDLEKVSAVWDRSRPNGSDDRRS